MHELRDTLSHDELASYEWGSHTISFKPFSKVRRRSFADFVALLAAGRGNWAHEADFRETVALSHELVHLQQDIATGLGNWDFVQRERAIRTLWPKARSLSHLSDFIARLEPFRDWHDPLFQASFVNNLKSREAAEKQHLSTLIRSLVPGADDHADEAAEMIAIRSLLEMDAVLQTYSMLIDLDRTAEGKEIMDDNGHLYSPHEMPETHVALFPSMIATIVNDMGGEEALLNNPESETVFRAFYKIYLYLFDLSLAHPPPTYFDGGSVPAHLFHPGLRFIEVNRQMSDLTGYLWEFLKEKPFDGSTLVEAIGRLDIPPYPTPKEVCEQWIDFFSTPEFANDPLAGERRIILEYRLSRPGALMMRQANDVIEIGSPIFFYDGISPTRNINLFGRHLNPKDLGQLDDEILASQAHLRISRWFLLAEPYQCPYADVCKGAGPDCRAGLQWPSQLPDPQACQIRRSLVTQGYGLHYRPEESR